MTDFLLVMPEAFLALTVVFVLFGEISYFGEKVRLLSVTAIIGLAAAFVQTLLTYRYPTAGIFGGSLAVDGFSLFFKLVFITLAALAVGTAAESREIPDGRRAEYFVLVLASALSMCIAAAATDLILAVIALQAVNILGFFLAGYSKRTPRSTEAAVKYMLFTILSGALLLYGLSLLFAATHSLNLEQIHRSVVLSPLPKAESLAIFMLVFLALAVQMAAFPMYLWAPDVFEGAPTPASGILSVGARVASFAVLLRFVMMVFARPGDAKGQWEVLGSLDWTQVLATVSGVTMLVGSLLATRQTSAKRMIGCLVIAQTGYLMMGVLVLDQVGVAALLYNVVVDLFAVMGCFAVLSQFFDELGTDHLEDFKGLLWRAVPECVCLVLFLLCLVGLPPLPGFIGKFALIGVAVRHGRLILAMIAITSMALSSLSVAKIAFSVIGDMKAIPRLSQEGMVASTLQRKTLLAAMVIPMILIGVFAEFFLSWAGRSLGFISW